MTLDSSYRCVKIVVPVIFTLLLGLFLLTSASTSAEDNLMIQLPSNGAAVDMSGADLSGLENSINVIDLPSLKKLPPENVADKKERQMLDSPTGGTRLTYGDRYRRNPDGSYGTQASSKIDIGDALLERALSAGSDFFVSWAEGWLGGFGKARVSFSVNDDGDVSGAGDFLYPIYDSESTTVFTQIGLRTMANKRLIGNFGLGQRFFPTEDLALGYNFFLDQDFSRNHTRGGVGVESWYDWVRLSANYYTPLSGWKGSRDFDHRLVEERPAEGYDARLTGYLPFYRNLAVTGAFEKWKGEHVGTFGDYDVLQKNPKIWSYGLEWTPVPAFSTSVNQRHSGSQKETQFNMVFNYHFGMSWEDQLSPSVVADMRTVNGSRHDFVNRQYDMILEYRAKEGAYNIMMLGALGNNRFEFQVTDGFGKVVAGQMVTVTAAGVGGSVSVDQGGKFITDPNGRFQVVLDPSPGVTLASVTVNVEKTTKTFDNLLVTPTPVYSVSASTDTIEINKPTDVVFNVMNNGAAVGPGVKVVFGPSAELGLDVVTTLSTNDSGQVTLPLTATREGKITLPITIDGQKLDLEINVTHLPLFGVSASPDTIMANVETSVSFTFTLDGEIVGAGIDVKFGDNVILGLAEHSEATNDSGQITLMLTGTVNGTFKVPITIDGQNLEQIITVNSQPIYEVSASPGTIDKGAQTPVTFTITNNGDPVGAGIAVEIGYNPNLDLPGHTEHTDSNGQITLNLTGAADGTYQVHMTIEGHDLDTDIKVITPTTYNVSASTDTIGAGMETKVVYTVTDKDGHPVGPNINVKIEDNSNLGVIGDLFLTDDEGQITVPMTGAAEGIYPLQMAIEGEDYGHNIKVSATSVYSVSANPESIEKDDKTAVTFTVMNYGEPVGADIAVQIRANPRLGLEAQNKATDGSGKFTLTLTGDMVGTYTVPIFIEGQRLNQNIAVTAAPDYSVSASPDKIEINEPTNVLFTVKNNGVLVGEGVEVIIEAKPELGLTGGPRHTDANGQIVVPMTGTAEGPYHLSIIIDEQPLDQLITVTPPPDYKISASTDSIVRNKVTDVLFTVTNQGNVVGAGIEVIFGPESGLGHPVEAKRITDGSGQVSLPLTGITDGSYALPITIDGEAATLIISVTGPRIFSVLAYPGSIEEGVLTDVTLTIMDRGVSVGSGVEVIIAADSSLGLVDTQDNTNSAGQITVQMTGDSARKHTLPLTVDGQLLDAIINVTPPHNYSVSTSPGYVVKGEEIDLVITVKNNDVTVGGGVEVEIEGNDKLGLTDQKLFTNSDGQVFVPIKGSDEGSHVMVIHIGEQSFSPTIEVKNSFTGLQLYVTGGQNNFSISTTSTIKARAWQDDVELDIGSSDITWQLVSSFIDKPWWMQQGGAYNGLVWGVHPAGYNTTQSAQTTMGDNIAGATAALTDIVGSRTVLLKATMDIGGTSYSEEVSITFGDGPLSAFSTRPATRPWASADSSVITINNDLKTFAAAQHCYAGWGSSGTPFENKPNSTWIYNNVPSGVNNYYYAVGSNLPQIEDLQRVSGPSALNTMGGRGAALAAGWPTSRSANYWTGQVIQQGTFVKEVTLTNGGITYDGRIYLQRGTVCRK